MAVTKDDLEQQVKQAVSQETEVIAKKIADEATAGFDAKWKELERKLNVDSGVLPGSVWPKLVAAQSKD